MKRILLASAACLAMSLPAMAQTSGSQTNPPAQTQNQPQNQAANQQQTIQPSSLSKSQVRELQMSLNKAGFDAKSVDGIGVRPPERRSRTSKRTRICLARASSTSRLSPRWGST